MCMRCLRLQSQSCLHVEQMVVITCESHCMVRKSVELDLGLLIVSNWCTCLFTIESVCSCLNIFSDDDTSQVVK